MKNIQLVPLSKMEEMKKLFNEYLIELSQFDPSVEFDKNGTPIYEWFACYWDEKTRFPIYFIVDENVAGLTLIRELENMNYEIAEFYVKPEYRKDDNAMIFAQQITDFFPGEFSFCTRLTNPRAVHFWDKFVKQFNGAESFEDEELKHWVIRKNNFKQHSLNLAPIYFDLINSKEKVLEGRLNDEKRQNFNIGDTITFYKEPEKVQTMKAIILDKYLFKNFDDMANSLDKAELGFANKTKEEMIKVYRTIYTLENENKYGVVIFRIKKL